MKKSSVLGRSENACYQELYRLGFGAKNVVIFPDADADLRREFVKRLMPKLEEVLDKCLKTKNLEPKHYGHLIPPYLDGSILENDMVNFYAGLYTVSIKMKVKDLIKAVN